MDVPNGQASVSDAPIFQDFLVQGDRSVSIYFIYKRQMLMSF